MPRRTPTKGKCELCGAVFSKQGMTTHLGQCDKSVAKAGGKQTAFHIFVESPHDRRYWLHLVASRDASLRQLDSFLRDIWLECCGHMSAFRIAGQEYTAPQAVRETGARTMNVSLDEILRPGMLFGYEYDFGSTTELRLSVIDKTVPNKNLAKKITLLARNEPPVFLCKECKGSATELCVECLWEKGPDGAALCDQCSEAHECDEEMRLPVVNSPRMGVCGYEG